MTDSPAGRSGARDRHWLTVAETAAALGVPEKAIRRQIALGAFPDPMVQTFGDDVRIHREIAYPANRRARIRRVERPVRPAAATPIAVPVSPDASALGSAIHDDRSAPHTITAEFTLIDPPTTNAARASSHPNGLAAVVAPREVPVQAPDRLWHFKQAIKPTAGALETVRVMAAVLAVGAVLAYVFFSDLGSNPAGFFCDEAEIGLKTSELLHHDHTHFRPALFYHHFEYHNLGALPLYAGAPIIGILGLTEFSVRLVSALWSLLGMLVLIATFRRLHWRNGWIAAVAFALTPVFIHMSRIEFGHGPSVFCVCAGFYGWLRSRQESSRKWGIGSGLLFAASIYGAPSYYIAAPLIFSAFVFGEICVNRLAWRAYRPVAAMIGGFAIMLLPILYKSQTDDQFTRRIREKDPQAGASIANRLHHIADNYGKYFNRDYLFRVGETGMPGGWNLRHSVPGAGELTLILIPLMIAGVIAIVRVKDPPSRVIGIASLVMLACYPLPDAITTPVTSPPYTVSVFSMMIAVPLLAGLGIHWLSGLVPNMRHGRIWSEWVLPVGLLLIVLGGALRFFDGPYQDYPNVSAGYYGWQYGAGPALKAFQRYPGYDQYVLDGDFNSAFVFLDFYYHDDPEMRAKSAIGWPERANSQQRVLCAVRAERYNALVQSGDHMRRYVKIIDLIRYPNGQIAMYLVEIGPTDQWPGRSVPF